MPALRYAGDEFIAMFPRVDKEDTGHTIQRIQEVVQRCPVNIEGEHAAHIGVSIGASTFPMDEKDPERLLSVADRPMYEDKLFWTRG